MFQKVWHDHLQVQLPSREISVCDSGEKAALAPGVPHWLKKIPHTATTTCLIEKVPWGLRNTPTTFEHRAPSEHARQTIMENSKSSVCMSQKAPHEIVDHIFYNIQLMFHDVITGLLVSSPE